MKIQLPKLAGVTLIELLLVMALFPIVLVALSWVFVSITEGQLRTIAQSSLDQEQQFILSRIGVDINRATALLQPATPGATTSALVLQLPDGQVQYSVTNGQLSRADATGNAAVNSSRAHIASFSAARLGSPSGFPTVRLQFSLASTASAQAKELQRNITTTYGLRLKP